MIFEKSMRGWRSDPGEDTFEMIADEVPDGRRVQLLRSTGDPALKQGGDTHQRPRALPKSACWPVSVIVVWPACSVLRPTEDINHGRRVIASRRASGFARRTNRLYPL